MRHYYLYVSPRNFANENKIFKVPSNLKHFAQKYLEKINNEGGKAYWLSYKEALQLIKTNKQMAKQVNTYTNPIGAIEFELFTLERGEE